MKYLVAYYSRTGNNKTIGETIAKALSADIDEIIDKKKRTGKINWLRAGREALARKLTDIQFEKNPQDYDVLVASNMFGDIISDLSAQLVGGLGFASTFVSQSSMSR